MKACILSAGVGSRLSPLTNTRPKHMITIAGKPLLSHTFDRLKKANITEILMVVGYRKEQIQEYYGDGHDHGLKIEYIEQKEFLGTGHAAKLAEEFAGSDPFMLIYGDLLMDGEVFQKCVDRYKKGDTDAIIALFEVPDPQKYGIISLNEEGYVKQIIEKPPSDEYGNLANAGVYIFNPQIFQGIDKTQKSVRGEYELTDSMQILVNEGYKIAGVNITGLYWSDVGHPWQLLDANKYLQNLLEEHRNGIIEDFVTIKGEVQIGKGTRIMSGTYLEGPLTIGEECKIGPNAYVRPYSSIGSHCHIGNSTEIKASIVLDHSNIAHLSYVGDSIIGSHVNLGAGTICANVRLDKKEIGMQIKDTIVNTRQKKLGAVIGDHASIGINVSIMPGKKIKENSHVLSGAVIASDID